MESVDKELLYKNMKKNTHSKISDCINNFILRDNLMFYGYFLLNVNFYETRSLSTAGVNFRNLRMNFYYNPDFLDKLTEKQVAFLVIHELFHLLFNHPKRGKGYKHELANIAMDMIINELILEKHENVSEFIPNLIEMDSNYKDDRIFEILYDWLNKKHESWKEKYGEENKKDFIGDLIGEGGSSGNKKDDKDKRKEENEELGIDESTRKVFENHCEGFDEHFWDDVPEEIKKEIVRKQIENLKQRGLIGANENYILSKLIKKSNNNFLRLLKRSVSSLKGFSKVKSIKKPNRREIDGLKGKNKYSNLINCILDTSGSMNGQFELILSEIFKDDYQINLIQCDTDVKNFVRIRNKNEIKKMKIKGLGGTTLQPGIDYINSPKELKGKNLVILTDGYTDSLDFSNSKNAKVLILTVGENCPIAKGGKNVKQFHVEKKEC
jgi:predicted metal-dependent peptidase